MMKVYREGARRILAGQKKKSTILITSGGVGEICWLGKVLTAKRMPECQSGLGFQGSGVVEKLRTGVDNVVEFGW
jgi:hypothetical protein